MVDLLCRTKSDPNRIQNWVSRALSLSVQELQAVLSESNYVLTLDYAVKMINIHERKLSGLSVVIQGETGVGKTCLLETLSKLWNLSSVECLSKVRNDITEAFCQFLHSFLSCTQDQTAVAKINEILAALSDLKKGNLTIDLLELVLNMNQWREVAGIGKRSVKRLVKMSVEMHRILMDYRGNPIFCIVDPPAGIAAVGKKVANLFNDVLDSTKVILMITHFRVTIFRYFLGFLLDWTVGQVALCHSSRTTTKYVL